MEHVVGMGVDVEAVGRFVEVPGGLFTEAEVAYCAAQGDAAEAFAGTWCAKEASVKALSGLTSVLPTDIEVTRDQRGAPQAEVRPARRGSVRLPRLYVSISHSGGFAVAVAAAVLTGEPPRSAP